MTFDLYTLLIQFLLPIIAAALTGGGIVAYFQYRTSKPESEAKAKQINTSAEISVAEAWRQYAERVEKRFNDLEKKHMENERKLLEKDREIAQLQSTVLRLETDLSKYQDLAHKVERARESIHKNVDSSIDAAKQPRDNKGDVRT